MPLSLPRRIDGYHLNLFMVAAPLLLCSMWGKLGSTGLWIGLLVFLWDLVVGTVFKGKNTCGSHLTRP